jgi:CheY-like chemotaxis protein
MGGEVELRSEPGQGTTATLQLELPIAAFAGAFNGGAVPVSGAAPRTAADPARERWRILVVEDHEINRKVVARQVARLGYQCEVAADGEQALVMLAGNRFDLVLTDCHMPQMDGYTLTRLLRQGKVPGMSTIPVIALSAGVLEEQIQRCRDAGMDDFLPKPVLMGALDEAITRHLLPSPPPVTGPASPFLESLDRSDEGGDLLRELLQVSREDLAIYDQLVAAGDTNAAREMLHRMRGALLLLGVRMPLGTTGAGSRDAVAEAMAQLERLVGRLRS